MVACACTSYPPYTRSSQATSLCSPHAPRSRFLTSSVAESSQVGSLGVGGGCLRCCSRGNTNTLMLILRPLIHPRPHNTSPHTTGDIQLLAGLVNLTSLNLSGGTDIYSGRPVPTKFTGTCVVGCAWYQVRPQGNTLKNLSRNVLHFSSPFPSTHYLRRHQRIQGHADRVAQPLGL